VKTRGQRPRRDRKPNGGRHPRRPKSGHEASPRTGSNKNPDGGGFRSSVSLMDVGLRVLEALDSPCALRVAMLLEAGDPGALDGSISPLGYDDPVNFFLDRQATSLLAKNEHIPSPYNRRGEALKKFIEAEDRCAETNLRIKALGALGNATRSDVDQAFCLARRKIAEILGPVPTLADLDFRFGPGSSLQVRGDTSVYQKVHSPLECTSSLLPVVSELLGEIPGWHPEGSTVTIEIVPGSRLDTVPKDAKIHRPICVEPLLNGLMQKGIGSYMRECLRAFGLDLDRQDVNQVLAKEAYYRGLATVDFSSASDLIAYMLVLDLLPIDWVEFLERCRSESYTIEGGTYPLNKWSSMGNAYTFELETLIFYALGWGCMKVLGLEPITRAKTSLVNLRVYGDDVIIPTAAFDLFSEVCSHAGFVINDHKSFTCGSFYESCGMDYFRGYLVRPLQWKLEMATVRDLMYAANTVWQMANRLSDLGSVATHLPVGHHVDRLLEAHAWIIQKIPRKLRLTGPPFAGDGHLWCDIGVARPRYRYGGGEHFGAFLCYSTITERPRRVVILPEDAEPDPRKRQVAQPEFTAFATYFCGHSEVDDEERRGREYVLRDDEPPYYPRLRKDVTIPACDKGGSYTIRGSGPLRTVVRSIPVSKWQDLPLPWGDRAIRLCSEW